MRVGRQKLRAEGDGVRSSIPAGVDTPLKGCHLLLEAGIQASVFAGGVRRRFLDSAGGKPPLPAPEDVRSKGRKRSHTEDQSDR